MTDDLPAFDLHHDADSRRFSTRLEGHEAELVYSLRDGRMVIEHTGVPEAIGGRGSRPSWSRRLWAMQGHRDGAWCLRVPIPPRTSSGIPSTPIWWMPDRDGGCTGAALE